MTDFEIWQSELESRLDFAIKKGRNIGLSEFEIFMTRIRSVNVELMNGLVNAKNGGQIGIGVRAVTDKKIGYASASGLTDSAITFALENAMAMSKSLKEQDEKWSGFYAGTKKGDEGDIDLNIIQYDSGALVTQVNEVITETKQMDDRIFSVGGSISSTYGVIGVANSEELLKSSKTTQVTGGLQVQAKEGDKRKGDGQSLLLRKVPETLSGFLKPSVDKVKKLLGAQPLNSSQVLPVVFDNASSSQMLGRSLSNAINGEMVINNRSGFADKIGDQVADSKINVYDDGQAFDVPNVMSIDTEGVAKSTSPIIEDGILLSYIFDVYHANIYNVEPTGNAVRFGSQPYENGPNIAPNPLRMKPGNKSQEEIIAGIDNGILLTGGFMGLHTTNVISGDYSVVNQQAFKIENGEIGSALEAVTVAGNHYDWFKDIVALGNEQDIKPGFFGPPSKVPSLEVKGITVSG